MTVWIPIIISVIVLLLDIIKDKDKYLSYFDGLKSRMAERAERKRALAFIGKLTDPDSKQQPSVLVLFIPIFLISILSSAALSYLGLQPQFRNTIVLSIGMYLSISMVVLITFLTTYKRFDFWFVTGLFIIVLMVSIMWGIFVILIEWLGLKMMGSGIVAGIVLILWLWVGDTRASRQARKKRAK